MPPPPPPFNPGHNANESIILQRSRDPDRVLSDFESLIANQAVLFASGGPAAPNTPVTFATTAVQPTAEPTAGPTMGPTAGPSPEIEDEDEDNKLMIIAGVSLCVCMIVVAAIFMMKR